MKRLIFLFVLLFATVCFHVTKAACPPGYSSSEVSYHYITDDGNECILRISFCCLASEIGGSGNVYHNDIIISVMMVVPATAADEIIMDGRFYTELATHIAEGSSPCLKNLPPCYPVHPDDTKSFLVTITKGQCGYFQYTPPQIDPTTGEPYINYDLYPEKVGSVLVFHDGCSQDVYCTDTLIVCEGKAMQVGSGTVVVGSGSCEFEILPARGSTPWNTTHCIAAPCDKPFTFEDD